MIVGSLKQKSSHKIDSTQIEQEYKHLVDISPMPIAIHIQGILVYANASALALVGANSLNQIMGKSIMDFVHPDSQKVVLDRIKRLIREGETQTELINEKIVRIDKKVIEVEVISTLITYEGQKAVQLTLRDVTESKRTESRLKFLEQASSLLISSLDFETTLKNIANLIVPEMADYCRIVTVNDVGEHVEVSANHIDPKKLKLVSELYKQYKGISNSTYGVERILKTGKAEIIPRITKAVLRSGEENPLVLEIVKKLEVKSYMGIPLVVRDRIIGAITFSSIKEGRYYSRDDLAFAQEVGHRIAIVLDNTSLFANQQKAVRLRDDFLSVASHELKTPVTSLKAFLQVLQNRFAKLGEEKTVIHLSKMNTQINKLTNLIQDLLDVTKIQSGRLQFREGYYYFDELIDEVIEEVQRTLTKHKICREGQTGKTIFGDRDRIGQVLTNFLTNAVKYSPQADKVVVKLLNKGDEVVCCVQDFGIGISSSQFPHIFERFYRETGTKEDTFPGLGLGLFISSEIVKRQDGKIWAESVKGKGSSFMFSLPVKKGGEKLI